MIDLHTSVESEIGGRRLEDRWLADGSESRPYPGRLPGEMGSDLRIRIFEESRPYPGQLPGEMGSGLRLRISWRSDPAIK